MDCVVETRPQKQEENEILGNCLDGEEVATKDEGRKDSDVAGTDEERKDSGVGETDNDGEEVETEEEEKKDIVEGGTDDEGELQSVSPSETRKVSSLHPISPLHPPSPSSSLPTLSSPPHLPSPPPIPPLSPPPSSSPSPPVENSAALPPSSPSLSVPPISSTPPPPSPPSPPPSLPPSSSPPLLHSPTSPSPAPQEAVVAQLNQLQQTVVSHILQYQAGVIAQFQQLQQQMLSQMSSSNGGDMGSQNPQVTIIPQPLSVLTSQPTSNTSPTATTTSNSSSSGTPKATNFDLHTKNLRKRRASMMTFSPGTDETNNGEFQFKRKRTAFNEKQYRVLETTFEHNNFPDPIDQHCIALRIKTPYRSIKMWFQNRRASVRKRLQPEEKGSSLPDCKSAVKNASDPDARWYCTQCPATFIAKKFLDNHKEAHQLETLHCSHCNMGFTHKVLLDTHLISKCSSSTGVDLTHLKDENMDDDESKVPQKQPEQPPATITTPPHTGLPLLLLQKLQKLQQHERPPPSTSPPPLIDSKSLMQIQQNPIPQQQQLMQQLLLAQLQQAQRARMVISAQDEGHKEKQEASETEERVVVKEEKLIKEEKLDFDFTISDTIEEEKQEMVAQQEQLKQVLQQQIQELQHKQLQLQLQQIQQKQMEKQLFLQHQEEEQKKAEPEEAEKPSLTLGGLTIFPVQNEGLGNVRIKQESILNVVPEEKLQEPQPLTLQDQISTILHSQGLKSVLKIKREPMEEGEGGEDNGSVDVPHSRDKESMQEQIEAILKHQELQRRKDDITEDNKNSEKKGTSNSNNCSSNVKRHRRRTTVFNEVQLRTLYLHFTYCNFPDPSMFRIIGHITKLEPQVIKIWFQNERSRQRKRALHFMDEVNSKEKPYKCRDCGMSFAMLTFLVKHSMRHNGDTNQDATVRTCPLCLKKWNREIFPAHLKSSHNVNWSLVDEKFGSSMVCNLCEEKFNDQDSLLVHKHGHLNDDYGMPPQCTLCKTTFVNAICLEAHMETHRLHEWSFKCNICDTLFHDKVLLASHKMGHGVPLAPVSTTDRSQSQLQHTTVRALQSKSRKTVLSSFTSLGPTKHSKNNETKPNLISVKVENMDSSNNPAVSSAGMVTSSQGTTIIPQNILAPQQSTIIAPTRLNKLSLPPSSGPVSYVKLIPVQLIPVSSLSSSISSSGGQKSTSTLTTVSAGGPTTPSTTAATTTFISVPITVKGSTDANPILNYLLETSPSSAKSAEEKQIKKNKALPNLIPISQSSDVPPKVLPQLEPINNARNDIENQIHVKAGDADILKVDEEATPRKQVMREGETRDPSDSPSPFLPESPRVYQVVTKKRYVPILPMLPMSLALKEPALTPITTITSPGATTNNTLFTTTVTTTTSTTTTTTIDSSPKSTILQRPQRTRNVPNKKLWHSFDPGGYKRRRAPTYFTSGQREVMEAHFIHDNFPEPGEQMAIAHQLGIDYPVVKTWFQNTRKNIRKQLKEDEVYESDGPFHCRRCNVAFISRSSLEQHQEKHDEETAYHCGECGVYFSHPVVFNTHLMSHIAKDEENKKGKVSSEEEGAGVPSAIAELSPPESGDEEGSLTDSQDDAGDEEGDSAPLDDTGAQEKEPEDSDDTENYHPIMAVECILDNSSGEDQEAEEETQSQGEEPRCGTCGGSFTSLIALKEHFSQNCCSRKQNQHQMGGRWRKRRKFGLMKRRQRVAGEVRCCECQELFPDRQAYIAHFESTKCSAARQRIEYTDEEQAILLTHYNDNNFPLPSEMNLLAKRLSVRYRQIMHWFQNRRSKERKQQNEKKYPPKECGECKSTFVTSNNLRNHYEAIHSHSGSLPEFACLVTGCGAVFTNADLLVTHSLSHQTNGQGQRGESSFEADVGGIGSGPLWRNYTVLEAHYGDNNFPDPMDIGFIARRLQVDPLHIHQWFKDRRNQHLQKLEESIHERIDGDLGVSCQRALSKVCPTCDAAFICQTDLDTHKEMHGSSWAQVCSVCGHEYSNVIALETHCIRHGIKVNQEAGPASPSSLSMPPVIKPRDGRSEKSGKACFNTAQLKILDTHYSHNNFPGATEVWLVAKRLGLRPRQVTHWFQNKRGRDRRLQKLPQPSSHPCGVCGAAFICDRFLRTHRKQHRTTQERYQCEKCSILFFSSIILDTHILYHEIPHKTKAAFRKPCDFSRDPITEGQVRVSEAMDSDSEGSEPELKIDLNSQSSQLMGEDHNRGDETDDSNGEYNLRVYIDNAEECGDDGEEDDNISDNDLVDITYENLEMNNEDIDNSDEISAILKDVGIEVRDSSETFKEKPQTTRRTENDFPEWSPRHKNKKSDVGDEFLLDDEEFCMEEDAIKTLEKSVVHEEVFFDDNTDSDSDDDEDEPRLKIVSAYTISPVVKDSELGGQQ
ncbi:hypothetical protein Pcinc_001720 [Petrolisthes cinctipes]|uniref:Uncharacterized protein n=1 Tax=Petrolisthes cinctipes TaxID=88211 RepID=A0AAE1L5V2_PETCI|nr:hypothetical protein Pcinc_001720 [Petrolisthes cinctipes]